MILSIYQKGCQAGLRKSSVLSQRRETMHPLKVCCLIEINYNKSHVGNRISLIFKGNYLMSPKDVAIGFKTGINVINNKAIRNELYGLEHLKSPLKKITKKQLDQRQLDPELFCQRKALYVSFQKLSHNKSW